MFSYGTERHAMSRKKPPVASEFQFFNVIYDDGQQTSNRKVATSDIVDWDFDNSVKTAIEEQDRKIREQSGRARGEITAITKVAAR